MHVLEKRPLGPFIVIIKGCRAAPSRCGIHSTQYYTKKKFPYKNLEPTCMRINGVCVRMFSICVYMHETCVRIFRVFVGFSLQQNILQVKVSQD